MEYLGNHEAVLMAVLEGRVDAGAPTLAVGDVRDGVEVVSSEQQMLLVRREGRLEQSGWKAGVPSVVNGSGTRASSRLRVEPSH